MYAPLCRPRVTDMSSKSKKRKSDAAALRVGEYKLRRGTEDVDGAIQRRKVADAYALSQQEFTNRARFVDQNGNSYALPRAGDAVYERYRSSGSVDSIAESGFPSKTTDIRVGRSNGTCYGRALLYVRKKRSRKLERVPRGTVQLLDTETLRVYTARVDRAIFRRNSKSGHVLFGDFTGFGTVSDPKSFTRRP